MAIESAKPVAFPQENFFSPLRNV